MPPSRRSIATRVRFTDGKNPGNSNCRGRDFFSVFSVSQVEQIVQAEAHNIDAVVRRDVIQSWR